MNNKHAWLIVVALGVSTWAAAGPFNTTSDRRVLTTSSPVYPKKARDGRIEGEVTVCYAISTNGKVRRPYIESSTNKIFNRAARKAARGITYAQAEPGATNNLASACSTYRFQLTPDVGESASG